MNSLHRGLLTDGFPLAARPIPESRASAADEISPTLPRSPTRPWAWLRFLPVAFCGLCLVWSLQVQARQANRFDFHEDEALYTSYALDILHGRPFCSASGVDKPPVLFYLQALSMGAFGEDAVFARLPNILAVMGVIVLCFRISRRVYGAWSCFWILPPVTLSPLLERFGPTAFTDTLGVLFSIGALESVAAKKWMRCGLCLSLAMFSKQYFALFFLYVVFALLLIKEARPNRAGLRRLVAGAVTAAFPFIVWASIGNHPPWNIVRNAKVAYEAFTPLVHEDAMMRVRMWWTTAYRFALPVPWTIPVLLGGAALLGRKVIKSGFHSLRAADTWDMLWAVIFLSYGSSLIVQRRLPYFERFALPATVPLCLLIGRSAERLSYLVPRPWRVVALPMFITASLLVIPVLEAGPLPFGATFSKYEGVGDAFQRVREAAGRDPAILAFEGGSFTSRYYAYGWDIPIFMVQKREALDEIAHGHPLERIFVIARTDGRLLGSAERSHSFQTIWPLEGRVTGFYFAGELIPKRRGLLPKSPVVALGEDGFAYLRPEGDQWTLSAALKIGEGIPGTALCRWRHVRFFSSLRGGTALRYRLVGSEMTIHASSATDAIQAHNPDIRNLHVRVLSPSLVTVSGEAQWAPNRYIPFEVQIVPRLAGRTELKLRFTQARFGRCPLPRIFCRAATKWIHAQHVGLPPWMGSSNRLELNPERQTMTFHYELEG